MHLSWKRAALAAVAAGSLAVPGSEGVADPAPETTFTVQGPAHGDYGDVGLPPDQADATMTDTLQAAYDQP
jgi:hypothetical protein